MIERAPAGSTARPTITVVLVPRRPDIDPFRPVGCIVPGGDLVEANDGAAVEGHAPGRRRGEAAIACRREPGRIIGLGRAGSGKMARSHERVRTNH
jgi:hypothetical protein